MGKPKIPYKNRKKHYTKVNYGKNIKSDSDIKNDSKTESEYLAIYVNEILTVNDFIIPAQEIGLIKDIVQIRTEQSMKEYEKNRKKITNNQQVIIDIDVDFRDSRISFEDREKSFRTIRARIQSPCVFCVSIATSPYFMNQETAIEIVKKLLKKN